jgi:hypothetical protein
MIGYRQFSIIRLFRLSFVRVDISILSLVFCPNCLRTCVKDASADAALGLAFSKAKNCADDRKVFMRLAVTIVVCVLQAWDTTCMLACSNSTAPKLESNGTGIHGISMPNIQEYVILQTS